MIVNLRKVYFEALLPGLPDQHHRGAEALREQCRHDPHVLGQPELLRTGITVTVNVDRYARPSPRGSSDVDNNIFIKF